MIFTKQFSNELPFMLEIPDGQYTVPTTFGDVILSIGSDFYTLHTARFAEQAGNLRYVADKKELEKIIESKNCQTMHLLIVKPSFVVNFQLKANFMKVIIMQLKMMTVLKE